MATNKLALIRYKTIDICLRNRRRKWTLEDLMEKVADALYEYEGVKTGVSKRTIQADIQLMRSDKLGYNAPILVKDKKYYTYTDADYSINNSPLTDADVDKMKDIVAVLKHLNGFRYFDEMSDMIARLENSLQKSQQTGANTIQFEGNHLLKGLEHIGPLHQAIKNKVPLLITYKSFKAKQASSKVYHPYLLKEYRNRWFVIVKPKTDKNILTLALDRIIEFQEMAPKDFEAYSGVDLDRYFEDTIGVTRNPADRGRKVILQIDSKNAPYVLTKPIHHSQQLLKQDENGVIIRIDVVLNFELEREILGFGECMQVLAPRQLVHQIRKRIKRMDNLYKNTDNV